MMGLLGRSGPASPEAAPAPVVLKGPAYRKRRDRIELLRAAVQLVSLGVICWIGIEFFLWVRGLESGRLAGTRPPGVEGFLPISALISLRYLFLHGSVSRVHPAGLVLLVLIALNALLLKRSFCSWICPVGTLSDSLGTVSRKLFRRRIRLPRALDYPLRGIKYLLLAFFLFAVFVKMTPPEVGQFLNSPYNKVADIKMLYFFTHLSSMAIKVLLGLVALSIVVPYFWCRYLCPYGALLAVGSLLSPMKVRRRPESCIDCGLCAKACPSHIPVDKIRRVDSDECFGCVSCVAACPVPLALQMGLPDRKRGLPARSLRPAVYALLIVGLFFGGIGVAKLAGTWRNDISNPEYQRRVQEIHSPKYSHAQGRVPEYGPGD
jgi:polyferredoxin